MIDEDRTMQLFGYTSDGLLPYSKKPVAAVCEECGTYRVIRAGTYSHLCRSCNGRKTGKMQGQSGDKSPSWRGGRTPIIRAIRNSPSIKNWRMAVFERDNYTCQMCTERGGKLEAHHIHPVRDHKNDLVMYDVGNGITLCKKCHNTTKRREKEWVEYFENKLTEVKENV